MTVFLFHSFTKAQVGRWKRKVSQMAFDDAGNPEHMLHPVCESVCMSVCGSVCLAGCVQVCMVSVKMGTHFFFYKQPYFPGGSETPPKKDKPPLKANPP